MTVTCDYDIPTVVERSKPRSLNADGASIERNSTQAYNAYIGTSVSRPIALEKILKRYFEMYKGAWLAETMFSSNTDEIVSNRNYLEIIKVGKPFLKLILEDLETTHNHWFYALAEITQQNPVKKESAGNMIEMTNDWIDWAKKNSIM
jgi:hypothetical protein